MTSKPEPAELPKTADQIAVAEYLASEQYQRTKERWRDEYREFKVRARIDSVWHSESTSSLCLGLGGLAVLTFAMAVALPIGMELVEHVFGPGNPGYIVMMLIIHTLFLPPIIGFAFATVVPMFWYGSISLRLLAGMMLTVPAMAGFVTSLCLINGDFDLSHSQVTEISAVMLGYFLTVASLSLVVQLFTPWTLTHRRHSNEALPPTGLRSLMELMFFSAVGFACLMTVDISKLYEGLSFFAALGLLSASFVMLVCVYFLQHKRPRFHVAVIALLLAVAAAMMFSGFFAVMEFGWDSLTNEILIIMFVSLYGGITISVTAAICTIWLRRCGWQCIHRNDLLRDEGSGSDSLSI